MNEIKITTQKEYDELPGSFDEYTVIKITGQKKITVKTTPENSTVVVWDSSTVVAWGSSTVEAWGSSRVEAWGSSRVEAWGSSRVVARESSRVEARGSSTVVASDSSTVEAYGSSRVEAWDSSRVEAWNFSHLELFGLTMALIFCSKKVSKIFDYATAKFCGVDANFDEKHDTAQVINAPGKVELSFEQWLERGYIHADGITAKLISQKNIKDITVYKVQKTIIEDESFVVQKDDKFSHGETVEKAIEDLRYKISDRDTSCFKSWKLTDKKPTEELIEAYRVITGACEFGVKDFCADKKLEDEYTVKDVIELTENQYGNAEFAGFFE